MGPRFELEKQTKGPGRLLLARCRGHQAGLALAMPAVLFLTKVDVGGTRCFLFTRWERLTQEGRGRGSGDQDFSPTVLCRSQSAGPAVTAPWDKAGAFPGLYLRAIWPRRPPWGQL